MTGFYLIIDSDLFTKYPDLSMGARMLYGFIKYKINVGFEDNDGNLYINYMDDNDPHKALQASKKQILKWTKELTDAKLINTTGSGQHFKVYLTEDFKNKTILELPKGNPRNFLELPKGDPRNFLELPKGDSLGTQKGTRPLLSYKQYKQDNIYICIPTIDEIRTEADRQGYSIDCDAFYEYNQMRGWHGVKDWRAALSIWSKNEKTRSTKQLRRNGSITGAEAGITYQPDINMTTSDQDDDVNEYLDELMDLFGGSTG